MYARRNNYKYDNEFLKALLFGLGLFLLLVTSLTLSFFNAGPLILGTEMNTNGQVEYLCVGNGCDHLHDMDW